jgi:hypothetical protein
LISQNEVPQVANFLLISPAQQDIKLNEEIKHYLLAADNTDG